MPTNNFLRNRRFSHRLKVILNIILISSVVLGASAALTTYSHASPQAPRATDLLVFGDALATSWQNWSWSSAIDLANASPTHTGAASIAITHTVAWGGLSLRAPGPISTTNYSALTFWGYGGTGGGGGGTALIVYTQATDAGENSVQVTRTLPAATWTQITVTLAELGNPAAIARINLQDGTGAGQPVYYVDEVALVGTDVPNPTATPTQTPTSAPPLSGNITVQTQGSGSAINKNNFVGTNMAMWIDKSTVYPNATFLARTRASGNGMVRLPGGSGSQEYGWASCELGAHKAGALPCAYGGDPNAFWQARASDMLTFVRATEREALYSVNINGTSKEAAAVVAFFNSPITDTTLIGVDIRGTDWYTAGYWAELRALHGNPAPLRIHLWEFGNETYGGKPGNLSCQSYGWETTWTCNGVEYINGVGSGATRHEGYKEFQAAMKAIDPSIVLGAVGTLDATGYNNWSSNVLQAGKDVIDFFFVHPYSYNTPPANNASGHAQILALPQSQFASISNTLKSAMNTYAGGRAIPIWITEHNLTAAWNYDTEQLMTRAVNALFMADSIGQAATQGYSGMLQWMLLDGNQANGTSYGLLNSAGASYTREPQYWAYVLWSRFGDGLLPVTSTLSAASQLSLYAGRMNTETYTLLAINKTASSIDANVTLAGALDIYAASADVAQATSLSAQTMRFNGVANPANDLADAPSMVLTATSNSVAYQFAPYSITLLKLSAPAAPIPTATPVPTPGPRTFVYLPVSMK